MFVQKEGAVDLEVFSLFSAELALDHRGCLEHGAGFLGCSPG